MTEIPYKQYPKLAPPNVWDPYELDRENLRFNDGWEEKQAVLMETEVGISLDIMHIIRDDNEPGHPPRIYREVTLGDSQILALLRWLRKYEEKIQKSLDEDSNTLKELE